MELRGPSPQRAAYVCQPDDGDGITVALRTDLRAAGSALGWYRVALYAQTPEAEVLAGRFIVPPSPHGLRIVAVASVPGAVRWWADCEPLDRPLGGGGFAASAQGEVVLAAGCCTVPFEARGGALVEVFDYLAGVSGTVLVPAGARVTGWSAWADAPGATVEIGPVPVVPDTWAALGPPIPVPVGAVAGSPVGLASVWPAAVRFEFVGTAGYLVELARPV